MAQKENVKDVVKNKGKFGTFKTGVGGGEPIPAGHKRTNEKRDEDQPRDAEGHFTYNAVNGKPLKAISKVHGHSRGTTIPPTLTGGDGTIHYYADKEHDSLVKGAKEIAANVTGLTVEQVFDKGQKIVTFDGKIGITAKDFIESAQEWVVDNKENGKELSEAIGKIEMGHFAKEDDITDVHEAQTGPELQAKAKAEAEGTLGKEIVEEKPADAKPEKSAAEVKETKGSASSAVAPTTPKEKEPTVSVSAQAEQSAPAEKITKQFGSGKYTPEQAKQAKDKLISLGEEADALEDDEYLESVIEAAGGIEDLLGAEEAEEAPEAPEAPEVNLSEEQKDKVEEMVEEETDLDSADLKSEDFESKIAKHPVLVDQLVSMGIKNKEILEYAKAMGFEIDPNKPISKKAKLFIAETVYNDSLEN